MHFPINPLNHNRWDSRWDEWVHRDRLRWTVEQDLNLRIGPNDDVEIWCCGSNVPGAWLEAKVRPSSVLSRRPFLLSRHAMPRLCTHLLIIHHVCINPNPTTTTTPPCLPYNVMTSYHNAKNAGAQGERREVLRGPSPLLWPALGGARARAHVAQGGTQPGQAHGRAWAQFLRPGRGGGAEQHVQYHVKGRECLGGMKCMGWGG